MPTKVIRLSGTKLKYLVYRRMLQAIAAGEYDRPWEGPTARDVAQTTLELFGDHEESEDGL